MVTDFLILNTKFSADTLANTETWPSKMVCKYRKKKTKERQHFQQSYNIKIRRKKLLRSSACFLPFKHWATFGLSFQAFFEIMGNNVYK